MTPPTVPLGSYLKLAAAAALVAGGVWLAAHYYGPKLFKAEQATETATDAGVGAGLGAAAARQTTRDVSAHHAQLSAATEKTHALDLEMAADPDGDSALPPSVADRSARFDEFLCELRPGICADRRGPDDGDAGGGGAVLPAAP